MQVLLFQGFYIEDVSSIQSNEFYSTLEDISKKYQVNIFKIYFNVDTQRNIAAEKGVIINDKNPIIIDKMSLNCIDIKKLDFYGEDLVLSSINFEEDYKDKVLWL